MNAQVRAYAQKLLRRADKEEKQASVVGGIIGNLEELRVAREAELVTYTGNIRRSTSTSSTTSTATSSSSRPATAASSSSRSATLVSTRAHTRASTSDSSNINGSSEQMRQPVPTAPAAIDVAAAVQATVPAAVQATVPAAIAVAQVAADDTAHMTERTPPTPPPPLLLLPKPTTILCWIATVLPHLCSVYCVL